MQAFPPQTPPPRRSPQAGRGGCTEPHAVGTVEAYVGTANADKARATLLCPVGISHRPFSDESSPSPALGSGIYLHPSPSGRVSPALPPPGVRDLPPPQPIRQDTSASAVAPARRLAKPHEQNMGLGLTLNEAPAHSPAKKPPGHPWGPRSHNHQQPLPRSLGLSPLQPARWPCE